MAKLTRLEAEIVELRRALTDADDTPAWDALKKCKERSKELKAERDEAWDALTTEREAAAEAWRQNDKMWSECAQGLRDALKEIARQKVLIKVKDNVATDDFEGAYGACVKRAALASEA